MPEQALIAMIICLAFALSGCDATRSSSVQIRRQSVGIHGGLNSADGSPLAKSVVSIQLYNNATGRLSTLCSGTAISSDLIVTAAHCTNASAHGILHMAASESFIVLFNSPMETQKEFLSEIENHGFDSESKARFVKASGIRVHPHYIGGTADDHVPAGIQNDIALLKLNSKIPSDARPMLLWNGPLDEGTRVRIAGFGPIDVDEKLKRLQLRSLDTSISHLSKSLAEYELRTSFSAGTVGGDSGGPAMIISNGEQMLWGILSSSTSGPNGEGASSMYESVPRHLDWLKAAAKELDADTAF